MSKSSSKRPKKYTTARPILSDATITRIRGAAHRYVQAGGSVFPTSNPADHDQHIANVVMELHKVTAEDVFEEALQDTDFSHVGDQERLSNLAGCYAVEHSEAAFLFGALVGLEVAALTFGQPGNLISGRRKGGAR